MELLRLTFMFAMATTVFSTTECIAETNAEAWAALGCVVEHPTATTVAGLGEVSPLEGYANCTITCLANDTDFVVNRDPCGQCAGMDTSKGYAPTPSDAWGEVPDQSQPPWVWDGMTSKCFTELSFNETCSTLGSSCGDDATFEDMTPGVSGSPYPNLCLNVVPMTGPPSAPCYLADQETDCTGVGVCVPPYEWSNGLCTVPTCNAKPSAQAWATLGCVVEHPTATTIVGLGEVTPFEGYATCHVSCIDGEDFVVTNGDPCGQCAGGDESLGMAPSPADAWAPVDQSVTPYRGFELRCFTHASLDEICAEPFTCLGMTMDLGGVEQDRCAISGGPFGALCYLADQENDCTGAGVCVSPYEWNPNATDLCTANSCTAPPSAPTGGTVVFSSARNLDNSTATFACNAGYTRSGTETVTCDATIDGTAWPTDVSTCTGNPCDASVAPTNGGAGDCTNSLASGSTCQPTCNTGYTPSGTSGCSAGTLTPATCAADEESDSDSDADTDKTFHVAFTTTVDPSNQTEAIKTAAVTQLGTEDVDVAVAQSKAWEVSITATGLTSEDANAAESAWNTVEKIQAFFDYASIPLTVLAITEEPTVTDTPTPTSPAGLTKPSSLAAIAGAVLVLTVL